MIPNSNSNSDFFFLIPQPQFATLSASKGGQPRETIISKLITSQESKDVIEPGDEMTFPGEVSPNVTK